MNGFILCRKGDFDEDDDNDNNENVPGDGEPIISEQQQKILFYLRSSSASAIYSCNFCMKCLSLAFNTLPPVTCGNSCLQRTASYRSEQVSADGPIDPIHLVLINEYLW